MRLFFTVILFFSLSPIIAQKKALTHKDYDLWKHIENVKVSDNGKLVVSEIVTHTGRGDGYLSIFDVASGKTIQFKNGYKAFITKDEKYITFLRKNDYNLSRKERKKKTKKEEQAKDWLYIYDVERAALLDSISRVKSFQFPKEGSDWFVIHKHKNQKKKDTVQSSGKDSIAGKKKKDLALEQEYALVYTLKDKEVDTLHQIKDFVLPETNDHFYFSRKRSEKKAKDIGMYKYNVLSGKETLIDSTAYRYEKLGIDKTGNQFAYVFAQDSIAGDSLTYELGYISGQNTIKLVDSLGSNLRNGRELSKYQAPSFSDNGKRLFFYSKPKNVYQKDTTMLEDEIPDVDIWHWKDKQLQTEQEVRIKELQAKALVSYYDIDKKQFVHIQDTNLDQILFDKERKQRFVLGHTGYNRIERSWQSDWRADYYIVDTQTGKHKLALQDQEDLPYLSTDGQYVLFYDTNTKSWKSQNLQTLQVFDLTKHLSVAFYNEKYDMPSTPNPYGFGGFDKQGNALVFDKFDIWKLDLSGKAPAINITKTGRKNKIVYRSLMLDEEHPNLASYYDQSLLISGFNDLRKVSGLFVLIKGKLVEKVPMGRFFTQGFVKADNADVIVYTKENFKTFGDLYVQLKGESSEIRITDINPQQEDFLWGTSELFSWKAYDGTPLQGVIYKPENFDPSKKYPMITYFYERLSDRKARYSMPNPSRSVVNPSYLVSNGYVLFIPDIVYRVGTPGDDAYNCVVSGVDAVEKLGYVDVSKLGIQGQSWGGYQVAYIVTKTNKFAAAMAGAPVSNMTSAYGGIRWGSGLNRAFQYEKSQSRIGKNLWDGFDLYIKNSPLFGIPKIQTPLLMMHNDKDGAVPYYQGIEMFMGMRRLQKPAWLLVYNDEKHNLTKMKNRQDLSIRMMQFFDHYLRGTSMPTWMQKGIDRVHKGKELGY